MGLSARQSLFVEGLVLGKSRAEAGRLASVAPRTARRWASLPVVRAEVRRLQSENMARAARLAAHMATEALEVLGAVLDDDGAPASVRVAACRCLLEHARGLHSDTVVAERLDEIERVVFANEGIR